ncbi:MAG TPA: MBL fold metallo-hydrolase [Candidatus Polarisedimenticolaceae bacterium]|nr:MBL fold metallo-hydrolase [Candidatus Polarisedimenticolaceae bacterium]
MRTAFLPSLLNRPCEDPGLWVDLQDEGRSILLDLGDLRHVPSRKLLRVERAVVTHTHMDHFVGFDHLLRLMLGRGRELVVTGPPGFLDRVAGKIAAYTWNLIHDYPIRLRAEEVDGERIRAVLYTGESGMSAIPQGERRAGGTLHAERLYTMHATLLDHGVPVLGVALHETEHLSVNRDRMEKMGLAPGPWLRDLKDSVRRCAPGDEPVDAAEAGGRLRRFRRDALSEALILRRPGQRLAYVTDVRFTPENVARILPLAAGVDLFVCEAAFLESDAALAAERSHLTARQAGFLAREAGAKRLAPFHLSPRYKGREQEILDEAAEAFGGPVLLLPDEATRGEGSA